MILLEKSFEKVPKEMHNAVLELVTVKQLKPHPREDCEASMGIRKSRAGKDRWLCMPRATLYPM